MSKKGVIEVQFNWIFILIAGGVILIFFANLASKQGNIFQMSYCSSVLTDLDSIMNGAEVSKGTSSIIKMPESDFYFTCEDYTNCNIKKNFKNRIIFSPSRIKGTEMITLALSWDIPFRATNFLYLTSPEIRYIFVNSSPGAPGAIASNTLITSMLSDLPDQLNVERVNFGDLNNLEEQNNYKIKFIFLNYDDDQMTTTVNILSFKGMKDSDVSAINIKPSSNIVSSANELSLGVVDYYQKSGSQFKKTASVLFFKKELLYGAIFSEDYEFYNCSLSKSLIKGKVVTDVYIERSNLLLNYYTAVEPEKASCKTDFSQGKNAFDAVKSIFIIPNSDIVLKGISEKEITFVSLNRVAEQHSCPLIY